MLQERCHQSGEVNLPNETLVDGVYRVNLNGDFNVPYCKKHHMNPCEAKKVRAASSALQAAKLRCCDFAVAVKQARSGDVVYLDPPYTVAHSNNGFIKYNAPIFSWKDQIRLAKLASVLADRGCHVLVSNAGHDSIKELYRDFACISIKRSSLIAASGSFRREIVECLFHT